jgi:DNA-directed RNA polymerase subunit H (RpoH/RPB5)
MAATTTSTSEVLRSFATIRAMLRDRGLRDLASLDDAALAGDDAIAALAADQSVFHVDLPSCGVRVVYDLHPKFKMADVRALLSDWGGGSSERADGADGADGGARACILVVRERPVQGKVMEELLSDGRDVQMFLLKDLQFNIMEHELVPPHEPIRDEAQIAAVMRRYRLKSRFQLPLILSTDPVARHLALKHGELVRILRPSPSSGTYVMYRCCQRA